MTSATTFEAEENRIARHNTLIYSLCRALGGSAAIVNVSLGGLAGSYLLAADKSLATAPVTSFNIGVALGAIPAAMMTRWLGRKYGFIAGLLIGIIGVLICAWALIEKNFVIFCLGAILNGVSGGFGQQYRFAAADRGTPQFRQKAISYVLLGGIIAALISTPIIIFTRDLLLPTPFAGAFVVVGVVMVLAAALMGLLISGKAATANTSQTATVQRPLGRIICQPRFIVAVICGTSTYALMSFVMTGAPLAMVAANISLDDTALGIQWHVIAMFAPSFVTGNLIIRFGKEKIVMTGMILLIACGLVALQGQALWNFWLSLMLLGVGWNFGFIAATSMITDTYQESEKNKAQGANDFILFTTVAFSSLMSGLVFSNYGWQAINTIIFPIAAFAIGSLAWLLWLERKQTAISK